MQHRNKRFNDTCDVNADECHQVNPSKVDGKTDSRQPLNPMADAYNPAAIFMSGLTG
jgi:hypothetical protein